MRAPIRFATVMMLLLPAAALAQPVPRRLPRRPTPLQPPPVEERPEETEGAKAAAREQGFDLDCIKRARTRADLVNCVLVPDQIEVRAKPPPRSASDWEVDEQTIRSAPHQSGADVLTQVPGLFVTDRGVPGRAPHLSLRGFDGTSGQNAEIFVSNIPLNQVSHLRAPGYADMRLVMPEVIKAVRVQNGPYDPRQGDFAVAGTLRMDLGLERPGFWGKAGLGSFGGQRVFIAAAPEDKKLGETFAAFEADATDGPGGYRAGERASFVGQFGVTEHDVAFHTVLAIGAARFDFPGYLPQNGVERGAYPYAPSGPLGRDRSSQLVAGADMRAKAGDGMVGIGVFGGRTKTSFHQNLTGYTLDPLAGLPVVNSDDAEQVNEDNLLGFNLAYRHGVALTSKRDSVEAGVFARSDTIKQRDTRLFPDGTKNGQFVDAEIDAMNIAGYVDSSLYPLKRLVVRGGVRLDSLSYDINDKTRNQGLERTAQGFHIGPKITADYSAGGGAHLVASYGEGFRSPQVRDLREGERVPFAKVRSVEGGLRWKISGVQTSVVGFGSWLAHDRVFEATERRNVEAPPSTRLGGAAAATLRSGPFGTSFSATYTRAWFTESDARFRENELVPYAPMLVLRNDAFIVTSLGRLDERHVMARIGLGFEGVAGRPLPGGRDGKNIVYLDGVAALGWKSLELAVNATNLLGLRYYDAQYVYASNFDRSSVVGPAQPHVLVAPPTAVFVTLQVHLRPTREHMRLEESERAGCLREAKSTADEEACFE